MNANSRFQNRRRRPGIVLVALTLVLAGCVATSETSVATGSIEVGPSELSCYIAPGGQPGQSQVCFGRSGDAVAVQAAGLEPRSALILQGGGGNSLALHADGQGAIDAEVGAPIGSTSFDVAGTWAGGQRLSVSVEFTG